MSVVVSGAVANKAGNGGEAWVRLTWVLGLAELGVPVHLVESADVTAGSPEAAWFDRVVAFAGLTGRATLLDATGTALRGPDRQALLDLADDGAALVDLSGTLADPALVARFRRRAYVDLDPGWTQLWHAQGLLGDVLARYDLHLTVGDAVGTCGLPLSGLRWHAVRPPVLLSAWPRLRVPDGGPLTTVGSWRSAGGTVEHDGRQLGGKVREWRPLADVPRQVPQPVEAVLATWPADAADRDLLAAGGWRLGDPEEVAGPEEFRAFVQASAGELSPAQGVYAGTRCGWTSDRTSAYLATGRPVVVQDTGFGGAFRASPAVLPFGTPQEAVAACRALAGGDPEERASAARTLAEDELATGVVLPRVLDLLGVR